ncbi:hypothetical protein J2Z69_000821 [Paenibacillus shirakamiensis]|uniref:Uncharacterized protein n=1 Tax=Paenibacillus shirakamiensis TaxID=1265935 RepID=A0ABS4JDK2_9BACL|nr:hypothetical protein [Paenibacillus shirakamiensis]MBP1999802.1 hypothetical protein [Paenibacillus shirakamiensis]
MLENTKKMLWMAAAAGLWINALVFTIHSERRHSLTEELVEAATTPQRRSILQVEVNPIGIDHFTGAQVMTLWKNRGLSKYDFVLNGQRYSHLNEDPDQGWIHGINLVKEYNATYIRNQQGQIQTINLSLR